MNPTTTTTTTEQQPTSLLLRATALKRRTRKPRLHSFCLPKENTVALLDFHCEDEPENDVSSSSLSISSSSSSSEQQQQQQQQQQPSMSLNRRKVSLKQRSHKKQRKNSFRVPSEMTQQLLLLKFANKLEINEDMVVEDTTTTTTMDESEPATITTPPADAPHADDPKLRRVRAMQKYLAKVSRRKSFSLPKETTKLLLQIKDVEHDDEEEEEEIIEAAPQVFPTPQLVEEEANAVEEAVRLAQEARDALKLAMEDEEEYLQWAAEEEEMEESLSSVSFPTPEVLAEEASAANEAERIAQQAQDMLKQVMQDETQYQGWAKTTRIQSFHQRSPQTVAKEEKPSPTSAPIVGSSKKKIVRCQSLKEHTQKLRLTSFRVPQENIKSLLHLFVASDGGDESSSEEFGKTALPRKIIRKSSFNACTA